MLLELTVENFAIIRQARLQFGPGLNVLSGETGAGKSLLIDAMATLLGGRASEDFIRAGAERAVVTAVFDVSNLPEVQQRLREAGFDGDELIISREIARRGRNVGRINDRPVTVATIRQITSSLVELYGQHGHQELLRASSHAAFLDAWKGDAIIPIRDQVASLYQRMTSLHQELQLLAGDSRERARTLDLYSFQLKEIDDAQLRPGEEEELRALRLRLANIDRLQRALSASYAALYDSPGGVPPALDRLGEAMDNLERVAALDPELQPVLELLGDAAANLEEAARLLRSHLESTQLDNDQLEQVETRWRLINDLKRKYGDTIEEILEYRQHIATEIERLENSEVNAQKLEQELQEIRRQLAELLPKLTGLREQAAQEFAGAVNEELKQLAMGGTLHVQISQKEDENGIYYRGRTVAFGPSGCDTVEFLLAANPGEPPRPLHRIASGGELSRIMLAIINAAGRRDGVPILIFDEIDAGIGGRTAATVAEKLAAIAADRQVLCITHLPQIAAAADVHFSIEKSFDDVANRVFTQVFPLHGDDRAREIARMLAGGQSAVDLAHARELLKRSRRSGRAG